MSADSQPGPVQGRHFALFLLVVVYTLNFLDRQLLSILAVPIKAEFGLNDAQLGWLGGLAFGSVYSILAIPAAWLADRWSRTWIMTGALAVWSGFTALCGLATGYTQLFMARMGVGVGEAGGVAPAYSLISDYFPVKNRARAYAVFSFGIPIGAAAGVLYGGLIARAVDWRFAFLTIGVAGLVVAPLFRRLVREPPRATTELVPGIAAVARTAFAKPSFWLLACGSGCTSLVGYGLMFWLPSYLTRVQHLELGVASQLLAAILFFGGVTGMLLGGLLGDKLGQANRAAYPLVPACAFVASAALYAGGVLAPSLAVTSVLFVVAQALGLMWLGPVITAVQHLGPARARSQLSALFLLINNLIGLGLGPYFFGKVSDVLKVQYGDASLKWAFVSGLGFYGVATLLFVIAATRLKTDWVD